MPVRLSPLPVGAVVAVAAFVSLWVAPGENLWLVWLAHPELLLLAALGCGLVSGLLVMRGRWAVVGALLALAGVAGAAGVLVAVHRDFSPSAFKSAAAGGDLEALEDEAYRAVNSGTLVGLTTSRVRADLGDPEHTSRRGRVWIWQLGWIHDALGPGDDGAFYIRFDGDGRVRSAEVG